MKDLGLLLSICLLLLSEQNIASNINRFTFRDCGGPTAMIRISQLSGAPDPLFCLGTLNITANLTINSDVDSPIMVDVLLQKKVSNKFVEVPCSGNFGTCNYPDLCELLEKVQCPDPIVRIGVDCTYPLKANSYMLPSTGFNITSEIPAGDSHVMSSQHIWEK